MDSHGILPARIPIMIAAHVCTTPVFNYFFQTLIIVVIS